MRRLLIAAVAALVALGTGCSTMGGSGSTDSGQSRQMPSRGGGGY